MQNGGREGEAGRREPSLWGVGGSRLSGPSLQGAPMGAVMNYPDHSSPAAAVLEHVHTTYYLARV